MSLTSNELQYVLSNAPQTLKDSNVFYQVMCQKYPQEQANIGALVFLHQQGIVSGLEQWEINNQFYTHYQQILQNQGYDPKTTKWAIMTWVVAYGEKMLGRQVEIGNYKKKMTVSTPNVPNYQPQQPTNMYHSQPGFAPQANNFTPNNVQKAIANKKILFPGLLALVAVVAAIFFFSNNQSLIPTTFSDPAEELQGTWVADGVASFQFFAQLAGENYTREEIIEELEDEFGPQIRGALESLSVEISFSRTQMAIKTWYMGSLVSEDGTSTITNITSNRIEFSSGESFTYSIRGNNLTLNIYGFELKAVRQ